MKSSEQDILTLIFHKQENSRWNHNRWVKESCRAFFRSHPPLGIYHCPSLSREQINLIVRQMASQHFWLYLERRYSCIILLLPWSVNGCLTFSETLTHSCFSLFLGVLRHLFSYWHFFLVTFWHFGFLLTMCRPHRMHDSHLSDHSTAGCTPTM